MGKVRVWGFSISLDGYGAGPAQSLADPLGIGGMRLHEWFFVTRTFKQMHTPDVADGSTDIDDRFAARGFENVGAWIIGRNMFGPVRGPWPDESWKGWWGDTPPYHCDVFVLTHHARDEITMAGGTVFHFVTDGIDQALTRARAAAGDRDVRIGGGVATIRQYLQQGLIDEMHLAVSPVLLGRGEALFTGLDLPGLGYRVSEHVPTELATHIVLTKG